MKKILFAMLFVSACATTTDLPHDLVDEPVVMTCALWDFIPATQQRIFIRQRDFSGPLADVDKIAGISRREVDALCKEFGNSGSVVVGKYYPR